MERIGFIGAGNMAGAIVRGIVAEGSVDPQDVVVTSLHGRTAQALGRETGVDTAASNDELVEAVGPGGIVVVAVKPHLVAEVLAPLAERLAEHASLVVSLAAGTTLATLESLLPDGQAVVRVMPNVNAMVGAGVAGVCGNAATTEEQVDQVVGLFETVGSAVVLAEKDFSVFAAIGGSAPAFVAYFVEALARAGVRHGMPKAVATRVAAQAVLGTGRTLLERGVSPVQLADMVSSPGGTTIAGTLALEDAGFTAAVVGAVQAAVDRDRELAGG